MGPCFWFGHSPSGVTSELREQIQEERFTCRRCGRTVRWIDTPKAVKRGRDAALQRINEGSAQ